MGNKNRSTASKNKTAKRQQRRSAVFSSSELEPMQKRFCQEYVVDLDGKQAAMRAGYSEKTAASQASRMLTKVNIIAEIDRLKKIHADKCAVDAEYVLTGIKECAERCMVRVQVTAGTGKIPGVWKFDSSGALKAYELIGRHLKMFTDKHEVTGANGGPIETTSPREKLNSKIAGLLAAEAARKNDGGAK